MSTSGPSEAVHTFRESARRFLSLHRKLFDLLNEASEIPGVFARYRRLRRPPWYANQLTADDARLSPDEFAKRLSDCEAAIEINTAFWARFPQPPEKIGLVEILAIHNDGRLSTRLQQARETHGPLESFTLAQPTRSLDDQHSTLAQIASDISDVLQPLQVTSVGLLRVVRYLSDCLRKVNDHDLREHAGAFDALFDLLPMFPYFPGRSLQRYRSKCSTIIDEESRAIERATLAIDKAAAIAPSIFAGLNRQEWPNEAADLRGGLRTPLRIEEPAVVPAFDAQHLAASVRHYADAMARVADSARPLRETSPESWRSEWRENLNRDLYFAEAQWRQTEHLLSLAIDHLMKNRRRAGRLIFVRARLNIVELGILKRYFPEFVERAEAGDDDRRVNPDPPSLVDTLPPVTSRDVARIRRAARSISRHLDPDRVRTSEPTPSGNNGSDGPGREAVQQNSQADVEAGLITSGQCSKDISNSEEALRREDFAVLSVLASNPKKRWIQDEIIACRNDIAGLPTSRVTVGRILNKLRQAGLCQRSDGERKGDQITESGRSAHSRGGGGRAN